MNTQTITATIAVALLGAIACPILTTTALAQQIVPVPSQPPFPPQPSINPGSATGEITPLNPTKIPAFTFTNSLDYSNCLEAILLLHHPSPQPSQAAQNSACYAEVQRRYGNAPLTRAEVLGLISAANFYATQILNGGLYPPRGQRVRIAAEFGYLYDIDANDRQMQQLLAPSQPMPGQQSQPMPDQRTGVPSVW